MEPTLSPVGVSPNNVAFTPDGTKAYVSGAKDPDLTVIDVATETVMNTIAVGDSPFWVTFSPAGG